MSTVQATNLKHGSSATNNIVLDASGNTTISGAATISGNAVVTGTLQANGVTGSVYPLVLGTAVASTSGTNIDFTGIPSWVRRVTVMFNGVSLSGTSRLVVRLGTSSGVVAAGYTAVAIAINSASSTAGAAETTGFSVFQNLAADTVSGHMVISRITGNTWVASHTVRVAATICSIGGGDITLAADLDRIRITTVGGTDTFDAGSINIMYE